MQLLLEVLYLINCDLNKTIVLGKKTIFSACVFNSSDCNGVCLVQQYDSFITLHEAHHSNLSIYKHTASCIGNCTATMCN